MKKLLLVALFALLPLLSFAQSSWLYEYTPKSRSWAALASYPVGNLSQVPVLGSLDVSAVAGVAQMGIPTFGAMLSKSWPVGTFHGADGRAGAVSLVLGVTGRVAQGRPPQFGGIAAGVTLRF